VPHQRPRLSRSRRGALATAGASHIGIHLFTSQGASMKVLTQELDDVAGGGFGAYDAGFGIGQFARSAFNTFAEMGKLYTPTL
jgi:hypothetical protein